MMNKRVYGILGISCKNAMWNADFTSGPKMTANGDIYGSDKALKYSIRRKWLEDGEDVLYIRKYTISNKGTIAPLMLDESYEKTFNIKVETKNEKAILENIFKAIDAKNFGATYASKNANLSIRGAVQIGQGTNIYEGTNIEEQTILSPFRNSEKDNATQTTIGSQTFIDEAHYMYGFSINPLAYREWIENGITEGYTEEDYAKFKNAAMSGATALDTCSKTGCENEFALFVETKQEYALANLNRYISFTKTDENEKDIITLNLDSILNDNDNILNVEIYYNSTLLTIKHNIDNATEKDILTRKEI